MALFIDLFPLSQAATDDALELIFKSTHNHDKGIWNPHESVLVRRLIELFTQRGLDRFEAVQQQIVAWENGDHHKPGQVPPAVPGMMTRWTPDELSLVKIYLEALPVADWSLDDHMLAVEHTMQRYLPADELRTEAEWLAAKAGMMGKVQANMEKQPSSKQADAILADLPGTVAGAAQQFNLTAIHKKVLEFGAARAAENVRSITEGVRHKMRSTVLQHLEDQQTGKRGPSLQSKLLDEFANLNRDWRRIAVTESGECQLQGYIASLKPGTKVRRVEQYANACGFCRKIHDKVVEVVSPDAPDKDPDSQIWVGKTNIGRSASPRKRVGAQLVERTADEMWWIPAGVAHPHCRGRWVPVIEDQPGDDKEFGDWLRKHLS
jgi:hypothetical protein